MKIEIQRQCDGRHPDSAGGATVCDARIEINLELPDGAKMPAWVDAWELFAAALGWRRIGGEGENHVMIRSVATTVSIIVPSVKTWVSCPECSKGTECLRCGQLDCYCMGGVRFDARLP